MKIFTIAAEQVRLLTSDTSQVLWDLKNDDGDNVASGVYLYLINSPQGEKASGKLAIIR